MARRSGVSHSVKIYRVGGSVRDELLQRPVADRDWVVVGATPEILIASGYRPVGRDFPVFLHPETHEEYALARTERKHGRGYRGFEFFVSPDVTLGEDLARRDLTINAMARDEQGTLVDPYGGEADLRAGILRHVSPAFAEDPLRVLRVARFAARFAFAVAPETLALMRTLAESGELAELAPERVWQELARGLMEPHPSRMIGVLRDCGALVRLLPEVDALFAGIKVARHPESNAGARLAAALDRAATRALSLPVRYAILVHDPAGAESQADHGPTYRGIVARGVRRADGISARLKVPAECRDAARLAARWHRAVDRADEFAPARPARSPERCGCLAAPRPPRRPARRVRVSRVAPGARRRRLSVRADAACGACRGEGGRRRCRRARRVAQGWCRGFRSGHRDRRGSARCAPSGVARLAARRGGAGYTR